MAVLAEAAPVVEPVSLDEAFLEPAALAGASPAEVVEFGTALRAAVRARTGLPASVGAGSGKQLAKIASELAKPDGLRVVASDEEQEVLAPLPVRALWGVGPVAEAALHRLGVRTVGALAALDLREATDVLGVAIGTELHRLARGVDERPVAPRGAAKQVSAETTFDADLTTMTAVHDAIARITESVHRRLLSSGRAARTVTVKIRSADFTTHTRSETAALATTNRTLTAVAQRLARGAVPDGGVRLIGVSLAGLGDEPPPGCSGPRAGRRRGRRCSRTVRHGSGSDGAGARGQAPRGGQARGGHDETGAAPPDGAHAPDDPAHDVDATSRPPTKYPQRPRPRPRHRGPAAGGGPATTPPTPNTGTAGCRAPGTGASPYGSRPGAPVPAAPAPSPRTTPPCAPPTRSAASPERRHPQSPSPAQRNGRSHQGGNPCAEALRCVRADLSTGGGRGATGVDAPTAGSIRDGADPADGRPARGRLRQERGAPHGARGDSDPSVPRRLHRSCTRRRARSTPPPRPGGAGRTRRRRGGEPRLGRGMAWPSHVGLRLDRAHVTFARRTGGRRDDRLYVHTASLEPDEIVVIDEVRVTSATRTVVDVARTVEFAPAVAVADAALRLGEPHRGADIGRNSRTGRGGPRRTRLRAPARHRMAWRTGRPAGRRLRRRAVGERRRIAQPGGDRIGRTSPTSAAVTGVPGPIDGVHRLRVAGAAHGRRVRRQGQVRAAAPTRSEPGRRCVRREAAGGHHPGGGLGCCALDMGGSGRLHRYRSPDP